MRRWLFLLASVGLSAGGAFGIACSNKNPVDDGGGVDATMEAMMDGNPMMDNMKPDSSVAKCPNYPVTGACDIVAQDCPSGQECVVAKDMMNNFTTQCMPQKTGSQPKGGMCSDSNQCVPGTECIMGRCVPHCCIMGSNPDTPCGTSPDGINGVCALTLTDQMTMKVIGAVCVYSNLCKPFQIVPCKMGQTCQIVDMSGQANCTDIFMPPGKMEKAPCMYKNDCQDGLYCIGPSADAATCRWGCYMGNGPYDASIKNAPPGQGGCPAMEKCNTMIMGLPMWFGICN